MGTLVNRKLRSALFGSLRNEFPALGKYPPKTDFSIKWRSEVSLNVTIGSLFPEIIQCIGTLFNRKLQLALFRSIQKKLSGLGSVPPKNRFFLKLTIWGFTKNNDRISVSKIIQSIGTPLNRKLQSALFWSLQNKLPSLGSVPPKNRFFSNWRYEVLLKITIGSLMP